VGSDGQEQYGVSQCSSTSVAAERGATWQTEVFLTVLLPSSAAMASPNRVSISISVTRFVSFGTLFAVSVGMLMVFVGCDVSFPIFRVGLLWKLIASKTVRELLDL
jgi:hypothetical protein